MAVRKSPQRHSRGGRSTPVGGRTYLLITLGAVTLSRVAAGGPPVRILGPGKLASLVTHLACRPARRARSEELVDLLWSGRDSATGRHDLRQAIWQLRRRLGRGAIGTAHGEVVLKAPIAVDRDEFLTAVEAGALERAVTLYAGEFLAGSVPPDAAGFERWVGFEGYRLRRTFCRTAEALVREWLAAGRHGDAQRLARRVRDADPHEESAWVLLLETLLAAREPARAAAEADLFERVSTTDGRAPQPSTTVLLRRARRAAEQGAPSETPLLFAPAMVGRDRELGVLLQAWSSARGGDGRHVHLAGGAGLGKTRLLTELRDRLESAGHRVLYFPARYTGRRVMYAHAAELAAQLARLPGSAAVSPAAAAALVALNPMLSTHYVTQPHASPAEDALRHRAFALLELVTAVSEEAPLALLCDDMGWADPASMEALAWVLGNVGAVSVLCVTAGSADFASPATERLNATALSVTMVHALASSITRLPDEEWAQRLPSALHEMTGGSPRLVLEQLQIAVERGRLNVGDGWACPDPAALAAQLAEPAVAAPAHVLVSPFVTVGAGDSDYLAAGLTGGLIDDLSRIEGLSVTALGSAMRVKNITDLSARAAAVGARYVLDGRVKAEGDDLDIVAQLHDATNGLLMREELCSGSRMQFLEQRARIVRGVSNALHVSGKANVAQRQVDRLSDLQAHECYLRARHHLLRYEPKEIERGLQVLRYGIKHSTDSGLLHAALGAIEFTLCWAGVDPTESRLRSAEECAATARAVEPDALYTHLLVGSIAWARSRPHEAVREYRKALLQDPGHPEALLHLAHIYAFAGKPYASRALLSRVFEVDPLAAVNQSVTGSLVMLEGRFAEAADGAYRSAFELDPCPPALIVYAMGLARSQRVAQACALLDAVSHSGAGIGLIEVSAFLRHALAGDRDEAFAALTPGLETYSRFVFYHAWHLGAGLALLGDLDRAFPWLRRAAGLGFVHYPFLLIDPLLTNMRDDARWPALAEDFRRQWEEFEV